MTKLTFPLIISLAILGTPFAALHAQKVPEVGYIFPPGAKAGETVEVRLAGYDWTPDMEFFVHDKRIQLIPTGPLGPIHIPGPPYWFGAKGRLNGMPLAREIPAKIVIPSDMPPGPVLWQAVNANGCSSTGMFVVGVGPEVVEDERRKVPQLLPALPITVSGRISKIEEVDRYRFVAPKDGPITIDVLARRIGSKFLGILEVRDSADRLVTDLSGANGQDPIVTFSAKAGAEYVVALRDIDFGGDRAYVYRMTIAQAPRVVGTIPAAGKRGETREVEFVGYGVATGAARLESVKRPVTFPNDPVASTFSYRLETPFGAAAPVPLLLSDLPELVGPPGGSGLTLTAPTAVTGVLDRPDPEDRYSCIWKKGEIWSIAAEARRIHSPLDVSIAVIGPDGKEIVRNDDLLETTDAALEFTVPADGTYQIAVSDTAGKNGLRSSIYRLVVQHPVPDYELHAVAQHFGVPIGGRFDLKVSAIRKGGFKGPILLSVDGLPEGVNVSPTLVIPADRPDVMVTLHGDNYAPTTASFATIKGRAEIQSLKGPKQVLTRTATARAAGNLTPCCPSEGRIPSILVASALKPRFKGRPVDADTGRKVHRGSTFPGEVIVERLGDFKGEVILQMAAQQSYQVHGITGWDVVVPPGVEKTLYPCFMPEWLETSRTSRMGMIAVAKVPDPTGRVRYAANEITGFITMTLEGALLKISAENNELAVPAGQAFEVPVRISRLTKLVEPARLELQLPEELTGLLKAEPVPVPVGQEIAIVRIIPSPKLQGQHSFTIRATAMQEGKYPVVSETQVSVEFLK